MALHQGRGIKTPPVAPQTPPDRHRRVNPGTVPEALDVITPTGVSQADELNPIGHDPATNPVTISGVRIPRGPVRRTPPYRSAPVSRPVVGEQRHDNDDPDLGRPA